ncbi:MAG: hypothetical protein HY921_07800 [Elusimicrobia bacterium]|nr:hypothetical protein [Elusimicrobiota bacterium]
MKRNFFRIALCCMALAPSLQAQITSASFDQGIELKNLGIEAPRLAMASHYLVTLNVVQIKTESAYASSYRTLPPGYRQIRNRVESINTVKGEGILSALDKTTREVNTQVVGIDIKGISDLDLIRENGKTFIRVEKSVDDMINGVHVQYQAEYRAEAEFVKGTWDDYMNTKDVELRLTEEGQKTALQASAKALQTALEGMKSQLQESLRGTKARFSDISVRKMQALGRSTIQANFREVKVSGGSQEIELGFDVELAL